MQFCRNCKFYYRMDVFDTCKAPTFMNPARGYSFCEFNRMDQKDCSAYEDKPKVVRPKFWRWIFQ